MKKLLCLLLAILCIFTFAGCFSCNDTVDPDPTATPEPRDLSKIWVCPRSVDYTTGRVFDWFVDVITNEENWPTILEHTAVLKLYIQQIYTTPDEDLIRLGEFIKKHSLPVAIELGGVRMSGVDVPKEERGKAAFDDEFKFVTHFIELGGRCDYITTDHALAGTISGRGGFNDMTMQEIMQQQAVYYKMAQETVPGLKVGAIESLGFFWVKGEEKQYQSTDPDINHVDFEEYISELKRICSENGVELDHFHIDFNLAEVNYDGGYGRILAVEDCCHSLGLDVSMIVCNAFHMPNVYPTPAVEAAKKSSAKRALELFEGYMQAGGKSDYLLFQRWQYYPEELGSENEPLTNFGIFKSLLDSEYFPKE